MPSSFKTTGPQPVTRLVLPGDAVFPEGITEDPDGDTFYVSGSRDGTIFKGQLAAGSLSVWQPPGTDGRTQSLGMAVDERGRLLVCGGTTGLVFAFRRDTGQQVARHRVSAEQTLLNDICVVAGFAYLTDSIRPVLWRVPLGEEVGEPEEWIDLTAHGADPQVLHYLNGIVPTPDRRGLLVVGQGSEELWRIGLADRSAHRVDLGGMALAGDGMVYIDEVLYACDNSEEADGAVRFWLTGLRVSADGTTAEPTGRWELSADDTPTTAAYLGGRLLLVNSQFMPDRNGQAAPPFTVSVFRPPVPSPRRLACRAGRAGAGRRRRSGPAGPTRAGGPGPPSAAVRSARRSGAARSGSWPAACPESE